MGMRGELAVARNAAARRRQEECVAGEEERVRVCDERMIVELKCVGVCGGVCSVRAHGHAIREVRAG